MESRGENIDKRAKDRPAVGRRSCDQCRSRKIGCDRASPCANCVTARINCTHSAVASSAATPKQRVLISAQYEQKIDGIARDIDGIKLLLQGLGVSSDEKQPVARPVWHPNQGELVKPLIGHKPISVAAAGDGLWDHSVQIIDFVKAVLEDRGSRDVAAETSDVLSLLRKLVQTLEEPVIARGLSFPKAKLASPHMPPLDAVVAVLRWAKAHDGFTRITRISQILPLQTFTDICRKVYFAVDEYSEIDFIIANAYLAYVFAEHVVVSGLGDYREYCQICRENLNDALSRLPLLLPASMEVIAALTLGTFNAVETCKATLAWKFISVAADLCQTLGYHRFRPVRPGSVGNDNANPLRTAQERLFWTVYGMEKGLSLRLGRSSNIRDSEITLPLSLDEPRSIRLGRINGMVYDQLYSPVGLSRPEDERSCVAGAIAGELRQLINETHAEIDDAAGQQRDGESDPMRVIYLRCDLVCQSSLLALTLRAIPAALVPSPGGFLDECVVVARDTLDMHDQCMQDVRDCKNDPFMVTKYINWAILYCPFAPFSILFTRAVQLLDVADLDRLDRFAASLQLETEPPDTITHPYQLYKLLCQAARLYFDLDMPSWPADARIDPSLTRLWSTTSGAGVEGGVDESLNPGGLQPHGLYDWSYDSQQIMGLLSMH